MSRLRNFVFRRKFSIYVQYLPHAVCDPATCHHHHIWFGIFRIFFRGFSILLSIPCSSLCSSWSALKIAYFVFAFVHVFYPTRTHGRRHCQSTYCYSCCAVRNTSAAHVPPFWYTHSYTHLISYTQIKSANTYSSIAGIFHCKTFSPTVYWRIQWHILLITKKDRSFSW